MSLINEVRENYNNTMLYHREVNYDTKLDHIWQNNMTDIGKILSKSSSAEELIDNVDQTFMYAINFPPENSKNSGVWQLPNDPHAHVREKQIDWLLKHQLKDNLDVFSMNVEESQFVHHRNKVIRNGKTLTGNFLRTLSIANRIIRTVGKVNSIIELGGGCGHQARTLSLLLPESKYTIVDLPETLIFSYTYIKLNFPEKKVLYVNSDEDIKNVDNYDFVFVPAVFADKLAGRSYDLFINTASMGEMTNETIHRWMDFVQNKIQLKYLFTLNRFLNVVNSGLAQVRVGENECSTSYDEKWKMLNWELEPIYCRCPYIDTLHSRYLEIFAERSTPSFDLAQRSNELYNDVMDEDWYRLRGYFSDGLMQARINVLVNDMSMSGTLFKLWESIRFNKNRGNVSLLLQYLKTIIVAHDFEEVYYYERLLNSL